MGIIMYAANIKRYQGVNRKHHYLAKSWLLQDVAQRCNISIHIPSPKVRNETGQIRPNLWEDSLMWVITSGVRWWRLCERQRAIWLAACGPPPQIQRQKRLANRHRSVSQCKTPKLQNQVAFFNFRTYASVLIKEDLTLISEFSASTKG